MDLSRAVQWWEEWQLRILVLSSLFVQIFLYFSAWVRTLSLPIPVMRVLRVLVWVAYIGGDALAIYALATLFNRHNDLQHRQQQRRRMPDSLEVLWAPVLLIHLGGQISISAYSLEDNELWLRHTMTILSQVTIAVYVFYKQWPGSSSESRLLQAAILLFVVGIFKFGQKPWALRKASFNNLLVSTTKPKSRLACWSWSWGSYWMKCCILSILRMGLPRRGRGGGEDQEHSQISLQEYVRVAKTFMNPEAAEEDPSYLYERFAHLDTSSLAHHADYICKLFVDLPVPYFGRLSQLQDFVMLVDVYHKLQRYLSRTYMLMYTTWRSTASPLGICLLLLLPLLSLASAVLFSTSRKDGYNEDDVWVTYVLLYCTAVQEFIYILLPFVPCPCLYQYGYGSWSNMVYQHSLVSFCARNKHPTIEMKLASCLDSLREYINKHWYIWQVPRAFPITQLVCRHVIDDGWKEYVIDAASYRRFNNLRGQRTASLRTSRRNNHQLEWKLTRSLDDVPFDESVLLWHIATDLCFHHESNATAVPPGRQGDATVDATRHRSREISNYMIYLLFIRPEMLMPGTRPDIFMEASHEIELILKDSKASKSSSREEGLFAQEIMDMVMKRLSSSDADMATSTKGLFIGKACMLADALMTELDDETERWKLIQGVWVEMLCYSASRCRGYLHARSLGEGGEYLSYVWLLWFLMGMETLGDRHQRPEPPQQQQSQREEAGASASRYRDRAHQSTEIGLV